LYACIAFIVPLMLFTSCQQAESALSGTSTSASTALYANAVASASLDINLRWKAVDGAESYNLYRAVAADGDTSYSLCKSDLTGTSYEDKDSSKTEATMVYYELTAVKDGTESSDAVYASVKFIPGSKTSPTWLILYYGDGDCYGTNALWRAEQNFCTGLNDIGTYAGSVTVATLWDGSARSSDVDIPYNNGDTTTSSWSSSYLLELNAGTPAKRTSELSVKEDYTLTASWMTDASNYREVDMSDQETLTNFLIWAQGRYDTPADHTIIMFADHGAGPYATEARAVCSDYTSAVKNSIITSDRMRTAFTNAGYGKDKKQIGMIYMDMCLEGSLEEAYEFKDIAQYYLASPNSELMYVSLYSTENLIKQLPTAADLEAVAKGQVKAIADNEWSDTDEHDKISPVWWQEIYNGWKAKRSDNSESSTIEGITTIGGVTLTEENAIYVADLSQTLSCIDLGEIETVASAVNSLAEAVSAGTDAEKTDIADNYLKSTAPLGNMLMYGGSAYYLFDLGMFATQLEGKYGTTSAIGQAAGKVKTDLKAAIVASWSDCYRSTTGTKGLYMHGTSADYSRDGFTDNYYGLTIAGGYHDSNFFYGYKASSTADENNNHSDKYYPSYYTNLDFAKDHTAWQTMCSEILQ
jgi:hypothetical protein